MNKEEKLKPIIKMMKDSGVSLDDVAAYGQKSEQPNAPNKIATISTDHAPQKVLPGMYVYADGLISAELIKDRQIKAVVGYVNDSEVLAVCLREKILSWSTVYKLSVPETQGMGSGKEATRKILESIRKRYTRERNDVSPAVQYCHDYAEDGVKPGEAFLASIDEWEKLYKNRQKIREALEELGVSNIDDSHEYWTSNESRYDFALCLYIYNGGRYVSNKFSSFYVRPVLAFSL